MGAALKWPVLPVFLGLVLNMATLGVHAQTRALLIGVSGYPALADIRKLKGPANDVQVMHMVLQRAGVDKSHITTLADGVQASSALPTRQAILNALHALASQVTARDFVIVYFSGHGSQQPQWLGAGGYAEPDGMDEIFLPYDIGYWDGSKKAVSNALLDDEIAKAVGEISAKGAGIWVIFDTCHAAGMAKAGGVECAPEGCPVNRFVPASQLGIPDQQLRRARLRSATQSSQTRASTKGAVYFFASQKNEPAAEEPLPDPLSTPHSGSKRYFGLFTHVLAQALPGWQGDFEQLARQVAEKYQTRPYPTPVFEGDLTLTRAVLNTGAVESKNNATRP